MFTMPVVDIFKTSRLKTYSITCFIVFKDVFFTGSTKNNIKHLIVVGRHDSCIQLHVILQTSV